MRILLLAAATLLLSCGHQAEQQPKTSPPAVKLTPAKRTRTARFDHHQPEHAKTACESCHRRSAEDPAGVEPQRPPHSACSDCHSAENYLEASTSEPLCATCHPANQILDASLGTRVLPFPKQLNQFGVSEFSHLVHTKADQTKDCGFCHTSSHGLAAKSFPAHAECYSCHVHQAGQKLGRCQDCHAASGNSLAFSHNGGPAARDYSFRHSGHTKYKSGLPIGCATCHSVKTESVNTEPVRVSDIGRMEPARGERHTSTCWGTCHIQKEETRCGKCHAGGIPIPAKAT